MLKPPISFKKIKKIIDFAYLAIIKEANFYPCLGLVSKKNNGIHKDMDINDFYLSAKVFKPYFLAIYSNYEDINQFS
ncbi:MAG: hypothetical protein E7Y34_02160, partial [Mycoplasma sp.]|nr:hypothetical protein [Mycoplasma sp.]